MEHRVRAPIKPPQSFMDALERRDPKLVVGWHPTACRWLICRPSEFTGRMALILKVENPDGSYRPLDKRTLDRLALMDSWAIGQKVFLEKFCDMLDRSRQEELQEVLDITDNLADESRWAFKKDFEQFNLSSEVLKQDRINAEAENERKLVELVEGW